MNAGGFCLLAPEKERCAGKLIGGSDSVDVAQVLFHERGGSEVFKFEAEFLEFGNGIFRQAFLIAQQQEAFADEKNRTRLQIANHGDETEDFT